MADGFAQSSEDDGFAGQYRPVRVLTYNVKGGEGGDGRNTGLGRDHLNLEHVASLIESLAPDVVALQEIAVLGCGDEVADQVGHLAAQLGMAHAFAPVEGAARLYAGQRKGCEFWGNAVLSRHPITSFQAHEFAAGRPFDSRSALETVISLDGSTPFTFFSVHLSYLWRVTFGQCRELANLAGSVTGPVVVTGDFNAGAGSAELSPLHAVLNDTFSLAGIGFGDACRYSFPDGPRRERDLDHVFVSHDIRLRQTFVHVDGTRASDHNPLVADLWLPVAVGPRTAFGKPLADDLLA